MPSLAAKAIKGLVSPAVKIGRKVYQAADHEDAWRLAIAANPKRTAQGIEGFVNGKGEFLQRNDPKAALDALAAKQITDPLVKSMIEDGLKKGDPIELYTGYISFGGKPAQGQIGRYDEKFELGYKAPNYYSDEGL